MSKFYFNNSTGYYSSWCKECDKEARIEYKRTKNGLISDIYHQQVRTSKRRGHSAPLYSRNELINFIVKLDTFNKLYDNWVLYGYDTMLRPSIDRINDYDGYSFDNIQITTWRNNKYKGYSDKKNGKNRKNCKAIIQLDLNGCVLNKFHSIRYASRELSIPASSIQSNCKGRTKTCKNFIFKYYENN